MPGDRKKDLEVKAENNETGNIRTHTQIYRRTGLGAVPHTGEPGQVYCH